VSTIERGPIVIKLGGELVEDEARLATVVSAVERIRRAGVPLVIVHGGGREIDAALKAAGIDKRQVDGLRITDEPTLDVVVAVLAGRVNTRLVAALNRSGAAFVGLTGADGRCGLSRVALPHVAVNGGQAVDLGRVGVPVEAADVRLIEALVGERFVPVIASIGVDEQGSLLNVNADTFAGHLAAKLRAKRLVIAGSTAGVLAADGRTLPLLDSPAIAKLVADRTATAGMIAKLRACEHALGDGADDIVIVDGRDESALVDAATGGVPAQATRLVLSVQV
jgi:acetylglutamate kinase